MSKAYEVITDKILEMLDKGVVPWEKPWQGGGKPKSFSNKKAYRGINHFLLGAVASAEGYKSGYWITPKQAMKQGGNFAGQKTAPVVFWKWLKIKDKDTQEEKQIPFLKYFRVFNIDQVEGVTAPEEENIIEYEHTPIEEAEKVINLMPNKPEIKHAGGRAFYRPSDDSVTLPPLELFPKIEGYYSTAFHELSHATGHDCRLGRHGKQQGVAAFGSHEYGKEELVAEMSSAYLCGHCRIEKGTIDNTASYIDSWRRAIKADKKLVVNAAAQAQKSADYILGVKWDK